VTGRSVTGRRVGGQGAAQTGGELRALKRLGSAGAAALPTPGQDDVYGVYPHGDRRRRALATLSSATVARLVSFGALAREPGGAVVITEEGRALLRRKDHEPGEAFRAQHLELAPAPEAEGAAVGGRRVVNLAESPLAWLARRKDSEGQPFISPRCLAAGERLRADFHKGRYLGRLTSDWTAPPRGSSARGPSRAQLDPAASVIAARERVQAALRHVGSGLDRLLSAVCLDGRGLDDVERGFGWPKRSGKVVLRIALERLADHYGLPADTP
jgi:hypothetical protein